jgi:hypothetical protein
VTAQVYRLLQARTDDVDVMLRLGMAPSRVGLHGLGTMLAIQNQFARVRRRSAVVRLGLERQR